MQQLHRVASHVPRDTESGGFQVVKGRVHVGSELTLLGRRVKTCFYQANPAQGANAEAILLRNGNGLTLVSSLQRNRTNIVCVCL